MHWSEWMRVANQGESLFSLPAPWRFWTTLGYENQPGKDCYYAADSDHVPNILRQFEPKHLIPNARTLLRLLEHSRNESKITITVEELHERTACVFGNLATITKTKEILKKLNIFGLITFPDWLLVREDTSLPDTCRIDTALTKRGIICCLNSSHHGLCFPYIVTICICPRKIEVSM